MNSNQEKELKEQFNAFFIEAEKAIIAGAPDRIAQRIVDRLESLGREVTLEEYRMIRGAIETY